jgi:hypothetical protein
MSNSTTQLQSIVDYVNSVGELSPVRPTGGISVNTALGIANDVMADLICRRFPWKWNRMKLPPFYTNSIQQDYAQIGLTTVGWLEHAYWTDINNTSLPKPSNPMEAVRDLEITSIMGNPPSQVCWLPNDQLTQGTWAANKTFVQPLGATQTPNNPFTNILDPNGNIQVLTVYGTTGAVAPTWPAANATEGTTVNDGTCVWTVAGPNSQGLRLRPLPPPQGIVYQVNVVAQKKAPARFTNLQQVINPIPDDYAVHFIAGFIVFCYRMSPNPKMQMLFDSKRKNWLDAIADAMVQGDRETDSAGFVPDRSVMAPQGGWDVGPANPYLYNVFPGR